MPLIHTMLRLYPFWAVPLGLLMVEVGTFMKRRKTRGYMKVWVVAGMLLFSSLLWLILRGDKYSDLWLRGLVAS